VVFDIFGEVSAARFGDLLDDARPLVLPAMLQMGFESGISSAVVGILSIVLVLDIK
jgi:hypothetical protein